jgi:predicted nucleic acid-binding protein
LERRNKISPMTWRTSDAIVDTSALLYLHLAGVLPLLETLFARTLVPEAVWNELRAGAAAGIDVPDAGAVPWSIGLSPKSDHLTHGAKHLGAGESAVLNLGLELAGSIVVLDDAAARAFARSLNIRLTGTLGILIEAKRSGLVGAVRPLVDEIQAKGFRLDAATRQLVLDLVAEHD